MRPFYLLLFSVLFCAEIRAQLIKLVDTNLTKHPAKPLIFPAGEPVAFDASGKYDFKYYSIREGLSQTKINKIFVDSRNQMWIGTYGGGINLYNGESFKTLNKINGLSNDIVWDFAEDKQGRIWIATDKGVSIYNGKTFEYINESNGLQSRYVWSLLYDSKGRMWMGTSRGGVSVYENNKVKTYNKPLGNFPNEQVWDIAEDKKGTIWLGTHDSGIVKYSNNTFQTINIKQRTGKNIVHAILCDSKNNSWFGTRDGLLKISNGKKTWFSTSDGLPDNNIKTIYEDNDGVIWIGTVNGIARYLNNTFKAITTKQGLSNNHVNTIYQDKWGTMWFGTNGKGISQLYGETFTHFSEKLGLPTGDIFCVYEDKIGDVWMGTKAKGVIRYDKKNFYHYNEARGFKWGSVLSVFQDSKGNYWFGTAEHGVVKYDKKKYTVYGREQGLSDNMVYSISEDKFGNMWFITNWSANKFEGNNFYYYNQGHGIAHHLTITSFTDKKRDLWIGCYGGGVTFYDGKQFITFNDTTGLKCNSVFSVSQDHHGNMWISNLGEGIAILKSDWKKLPDSKRWKYIDLKSGLIDDGVVFIRPDKKGNMWAGTVKGLNKFELNYKNIFEVEPKIKWYGNAEGFTGIECKINAFLAASDNSIWIPSAEMVSRYRSERERKIKNPPIIRMKGIKLKWEEVDWQKLNGTSFSSVNKWNNIPKNLELPYYHNHLNFDFIGIIFNKSEFVEYQWRLAESESKWSPWTKKHEATYSNIAPGKYTLMIRSRNVDKVESTIFKYTFMIHKPFWQTWWFRISTVCGLLFVVYLVFRWRTAALRKRQAILEKTVEERTTEVVQQKELIEHKQKEIIDSIKYAKRIQQALLPNSKYIDKVFKRIKKNTH